MPRKKGTRNHRMPRLEFTESPPLNTPWRPMTPSRSCLCPVTADVIKVDQLGHDWISPHFDRLLVNANTQVRRKRHNAAVPLITDTNTLVRSAPSRRVQFPPLQFITGSTTRYNTRSHTRENMQLFSTENDAVLTSVQSTSVHAVPDICLEPVEEEVQVHVGPFEDLQLTQRHSCNTLAEACTEIPTIDSANNRSDELRSCRPICLKPADCNAVDNTASCNRLEDRSLLDVCVNRNDLGLTEKSPSVIISEKQPMYVENISAEQFDISTPSCESEPSDCSENYQKLANNLSRTDTYRNMSCLADRNSVEPVRVLSFSHLERSLDETQDPAERVICAAELNANVSELLGDKDEQPSITTHVNCNQSPFLDIPELFSTLNGLTQGESRCDNTVLVSDTPVSDYSLSYRQRALKAANIRLRYRTRKS